jgi:hypothetical protein
MEKPLARKGFSIGFPIYTYYTTLPIVSSGEGWWRG